MSREVEWVLIGLDEKLARRQGLPPRMPVPKPDFESLAEAGLPVDKARAWVKDFLKNSEPGKSGAWRKQNAALVQRLEAFLDKAPLLEKAQKAFAENNFDAAISALKRTVSMDAEDHGARLNLASALANAGDHAGALKHFHAVRTTFGGDPDFHVAHAHVLVTAGRTDDAIGEFASALEAQPDYQQALDGLVKLGVLTRIYENPRDAASLVYVRSDALTAYLTGAWDAEPRDVAFFLEQIGYHEREGQSELVLEAAARAAAAAGADGPPERAELARAAALRALGRVDEALEVARAQSERAPERAPARVELAKCLAKAGRTAEAREAVERALELDPGDQEALWFRFWPADRNDVQALGERLPELTAFAASHPGVAGARRALARAKLTVGATDEALSLFAEAVSLAPDDDDLRAEYWAELGKQGRFQEIVDDAAKVENMARRDWKLRWNEAEAYAGLGKMLEARGAFSAINFDESLHVDVRRRAKRAVKAIDEGGQKTE